MKRKLLHIVILSSLIGTSCSKSEVQNTAPLQKNTSSSDSIQVIKDNTINKNQLQLPNFANLVNQVGNTVVNITAETTIQAANPNIDPFFDLFRHFGQPIPQIKPQPRVRVSMGSGFIISKDGYILTNAHVVDMTKKITIRTTDKREFQAKLIGLDLKTDIALLKVNANNLNAVRIGDPNKLEVGEWVAAIGAPFGFENSVTQGIVSAKGRHLSALPEDTIVPFIQTDVP
ncbi:MAG: trypsin-like peptidase domain-containing protein, partial [Neisseriaceae bacterium]